MVKCLIADDSKIIRMLFAKIMGNLGFEILEAEDGEEVVELCQQTEPDLIVMDYRLPALDGIDAMYKIRNSRLANQPKIMFCSSLTDLDVIQEAMNGGADDYVMKPFDEEIIISKLAIMGMI